MGKCKIELVFATILLTFFYLQFILFVVANSLPTYQPVEDIVYDCGSSGNSIEYGGTRTWVGDVNSNFFPSDLYQNNLSISSLPESQSSLVTDVPYGTARLSRSAFTYFFSVSPGQKFVRLYFYSARYPNFGRSDAVFSVQAGIYTLLQNFNASVNADASGSNKIFKEFCVYVEGNGKTLNITFTPTNLDSYAFINGIEIVSMPTNLYYTPPDPYDQGGRGLRLIGHDNKFFPIENYTSLELVNRMNIGGKAISREGDTGLFRIWLEESNLLDGYVYDARPANLSIQLNYSKIPSYTAPEDVYRTARSMGPNGTLNKSYNLTWEYLVDPGFFYMLRLHFCEFQAQINDPNDRVFLIYIGDMIAEQSADVIRWAGGKGIPYYKDYVVLMPSNDREKRVNLSVKLQANPNDFMTRFTNVILNGIEIFKLNRSDGNLAGQNLDLPPTLQSLRRLIFQSKNSNNNVVKIIIPIVISGVLAMLALSLLLFHRYKIFIDQSSTDETSRQTLFYSMSTNKSSKSYRYFPNEICK